MKFTGFAGGCVGKALLVILCILLGVVLTLGGLAVGGYIVLTKDGMVGTISDQVEKNTSVELAFDDSVKAMSVMDWGKEILAAVSDMSSKEIGALEKLIGVSIISNTIEEVIGVDAEVVKTSTLDKLGETVSNNLTINNAKDKFGIEFPDMPIFADAEFLASPLATAFSDFESYTLGEVIEITEESNAVLQELKNVAIKDIGAGSTDTVIKSMFLCELMTIEDDANMTLKALKYSSIESQYELDENGEIKLDEYGNPIYKTKEITEVIDGETVTNTYPLKGINETINALYVKDVVNITEDSAVVLRKMRLPTEEEIAAGKAELFGTEDLLVNELGSAKVTEIVQNTYGWNVMKPKAIDQQLWNDIYDVYVKDKYNLGTQGYFEEKNPAALENMTAVMLETARKGYWKATPEQLKAVAGLHTDLIAKYGTSGGGFADNNAKLQEFIAENVSAPQAAGYKQRINEMKEAALADGNVQKGMTLKKNTIDTVGQPEEETNKLSGTLVVSVVLAAFIILLMILKKKRSQNRK